MIRDLCLTSERDCVNEYWAKLTGDVAQWLEETELKSEDPGFDPLAGQVEKVLLTLRVINGFTCQ